ALGYAAGTTAPEGHFVVTVQLAVNYTRPGHEGETLRVEASVQHAGSKTAVVRGEIRTTAGELVATGSGTFLYLPRP
ncbi:MAG: PaaI family thioesterase, partial [Planctomycetaceae bacterium]